MPTLRPIVFYSYLVAVCGVGVGIMNWLIATYHPSMITRDPYVLLALSLMLLLGELRPILIARGEETQDEVTISSTFALALVLCGPLAVAVAAQAAAVTIDDMVRRKSPLKLLFNISQYAITLTVARFVYTSLSHRTFLYDDHAFAEFDVFAALAAAGAFFLVNNALTTAVVALRYNEPLAKTFVQDIRFQLSTYGVLLSLAPAVLQAADFSPLLLPLLVLPIAAVHKSASFAVERERQALHDSLTGLPNRALLHDRIKRQISDDDRLGRRAVVMLTDLDHFKEINDTLGHHVGDELLKLVATRLKGALREDDTVARLGGDEFAILAPHLRDVAEGWRLAERLTRALDEPFAIDGVRLDVRASIGLAFFPDHGDDVDTLIQRADVALYAAKETRGSVAVYDPRRDPHPLQRLALLSELRQGIENDQLVLYYQPKADAATGKVSSVEALVRWQHPRRGLIGPDEFVPVAENTGLIGQLTLVVLEKALRTVRAWDRLGLTLSISVNLSVRHLNDLDLPNQVRTLLTRFGVEPERLTLEVTESTIMADPTRSVTVLGMLRDLGVQLAVDDFGTGYSSLAYLKRLDVDELKIDKSFVQNLGASESDAVIVRSTIELGHNLGLRVVAEGVEDAATWRLLQALGCDSVQGYFLSRPVPDKELVRWLQLEENARVIGAVRNSLLPEPAEVA